MAVAVGMDCRATSARPPRSREVVVVVVVVVRP